MLAPKVGPLLVIFSDIYMTKTELQIVQTPVPPKFLGDLLMI